MAKFFPRDNDHIKAQKAGKERDSYICFVCGKICKDAHGHHVIEVCEGGPSTPDNIITLCPECHRAYHKGLLNIDIGTF
ncbi:HNH endonuclease [Butyrivibrio sp. AE3004]|uniref:HNH endonuclease n=1 Tax=Butyrivibrio sp. AE3004 TaxID=1506994 RepID=UPI0004947160|nr:HNH endonuclease [Butyrivibrio sp. AE3004]